MKRAFAIAVAALTQTARSRAAWLAAAALLLLVPVGALLSAEADSRGWMARVLATEGYRLLVPIGAIGAAAFLVRPGLKAGWAALPARRTEWFAGQAMAGAAVLLVAVVLFTCGSLGGAWIFGRPLERTANPTSLGGERVRNDAVETARFKSGMAMADPTSGDSITAEIPAGVGEQIAGVLEYEPILTGVAPPTQREPIAIWAEGESRHRLAVTIEARRRVSFRGDRQDATRIIIIPTDPGLAVGTSVSRLRFELGRESATPSLLALAVLSLGAGLLCMCVVLAIRALSTGATAALAGLLLLATLTLLPSLAPTESMARDLRRDLGGEKEQPGLMESLEDSLAGLPQLYPDSYFDEFLAGRVVPGGAPLDGLARLAVGVAILLPGALLFRRRQIR